MWNAHFSRTECGPHLHLNVRQTLLKHYGVKWDKYLVSLVAAHRLLWTTLQTCFYIINTIHYWPVLLGIYSSGPDSGSAHCVARVSMSSRVSAAHISVSSSAAFHFSAFVRLKHEAAFFRTIFRCCCRNSKSTQESYTETFLVSDPLLLLGPDA